MLESLESAEKATEVTGNGQKVRDGTISPGNNRWLWRFRQLARVVVVSPRVTAPPSELSSKVSCCYYRLLPHAQVSVALADFRSDRGNATEEAMGSRYRWVLPGRWARDGFDLQAPRGERSSRHALNLPVRPCPSGLLAVMHLHMQHEAAFPPGMHLIPTFPRTIFVSIAL